MITYTKPLSKLIGHFEKFPGIGPRTAQRLALFILKQPESTIREFSKALLEAHSNVGRCKKCFNLTSEDECEICRNTERNQKLICVVAETKDLLALERAREFKGVYHVIGGLISPMDSVAEALLVDDAAAKILYARHSTACNIRSSHQRFHRQAPVRLQHTTVHQLASL